MTSYEVWSLIIGIVSSIATLSAVIVALWQTKYFNKKTIKLQYKETFQIVQDLSTGKCDNKSYKNILIKVINMGNRKVVLTDLNVYFSKNFSLQILTLNKKQFPKELNIEESCDFIINLIGLKNAILSNKKYIEKYMNRKLKIVVYDSTGKKYTIKSNMTVNDIITKDDDEFMITLK